MIIALGTESALKVRAVEDALNRLKAEHRIPHDAELHPTKVSSAVPDQPFDWEEILVGAKHRATAAAQHVDGAQYGIGLESGLVEVRGSWFDPPCVVVVSRDGVMSSAYGALFPIPKWVVREVRSTETELGEVVKRLAGGGEKDPHNYFSAMLVRREEVLMQAVLCAMSEQLNRDRYQPR